MANIIQENGAGDAMGLSLDKREALIMTTLASCCVEVAETIWTKRAVREALEHRGITLEALRIFWCRLPYDPDVFDTDEPIARLMRMPGPRIGSRVRVVNPDPNKSIGKYAYGDVGTILDMGMGYATSRWSVQFDHRRQDTFLVRPLEVEVIG